MSTPHEYDPTRPNAWTRDLPARLEGHIAQMAPHQKERDGGKLLLAMGELLRAARAVIAAGRPHKSSADVAGPHGLMPSFPCDCPKCTAYDALKLLLEEKP